jgi:hypothetical protein
MGKVVIPRPDGIFFVSLLRVCLHKQSPTIMEKIGKITKQISA